MSVNGEGMPCDLRLFLQVKSHCFCAAKRKYIKDLNHFNDRPVTLPKGLRIFGISCPFYNLQLKT